MGSGAILREVIAAADILAEDFGVQADVWSALGINQLHRDGMATEDWNRLHLGEPRRRSLVAEAMDGHDGPVVIATDYVRAYAEQIRRLLPAPVTILGTDGFGRSDGRARLREFFRVDRHHITVAALAALADGGTLQPSVVAEAIARFGIRADEPHPISR